MSSHSIDLLNCRLIASKDLCPNLDAPTLDSRKVALAHAYLSRKLLLSHVESAQFPNPSPTAVCDLGLYRKARDQPIPTVRRFQLEATPAIFQTRG